MDENTNVVSQQGIDETTSTTSTNGQQTATSNDFAGENLTQTQDATSGGNDLSQNERSIPYSRFQEINTRLKEAERKAALLDKLQTDPSLAEAVLGNLTVAKERNPVREKAAQELREMGYVPMSEIEKLVDQRLSMATVTRDLLTSANELEKKYDGNNGMPKFDREAVGAYLDKMGVSLEAVNGELLEATYKMLNLEAIADATAKQRKGTYTEKPGQTVQSNSSEAEDQATLKRAVESGNFLEVMKRRMQTKL